MIKRIIMPAALLLAGAAPGFGAEPAVLNPSEDGVLRAEITLSSYAYTPSELVVEAGRPAELTLKSAAILVPHNFVIREPGLGVVLDQEVPAGGSAAVRFTPVRPGRLTFYCDKKLLFFKSHREKGMTGTIEVREAPGD